MIFIKEKTAECVCVCGGGGGLHSLLLYILRQFLTTTDHKHKVELYQIQSINGYDYMHQRISPEFSLSVSVTDTSVRSNVL